MGRIRLLPVLVALGLLAAACGDDDATTEAGDDREPTETTEDTGSEEGGDDAVDEDEVAEELGECGFLSGFATAFEDLDPTAFTGGASGEPTDFGALFVPLAEAAQDVADSAPDDIQDAFQTVAEGFTAVADELEGVVIDFSDPQGMDPEAMAKLESLDTSFGPEYEAASAEIETWMQENCGELAEAFDLDGFGS